MTSHRSQPGDLGAHPNVDPLELEPGVIVWDRFCIVSPVRHQQRSWSVAVTDLAREYGPAPHFRLQLTCLHLPPADRERIRRAVSADAEVQPRVHAIVGVDDGLALIADAIPGTRIGRLSSPREARQLLRDLGGLLSRLHALGVTGIRFDREAIRYRGGRHRVSDWSHVLGDHASGQDVDALCSVVNDLAGNEVIAEVPESIDGLLERVGGGERSSESAVPRDSAFVGRAGELSTLMSALAAARTGRPGLLCVRGPLGIGKSSVLSEFARELRGVDAVVLRAAFTAHDLAADGLGKALDQIASPSGAAASQTAMFGRVGRAVGPLLGELAAAAPAFARRIGAAEPSPGIELSEQWNRRASVIASALRAVGTQAAPLVILVDDYQFADAGSRAIVRALLDSDASHHTLVVIGTDAAVPQLPGPVRPTDLTLARLDANALEVLVREALPGRVADARRLATALFRHSAGLPLRAQAAIKAWFADGSLSPDPSGWVLDGAAPPVVEDLYAHRLGLIDDRSRWVLLLAAVRGGTVDSGWFAQAAGLSPSELRPVVETLTSSGLLVSVAGGLLRFPHDSVGARVTEAADPQRLAAAHGKVAAWLRKRGPGVSAAQLAYHLELSADKTDPDDLLALHVSAGQEALAHYRLRRAAWHFDCALTLDASLVEALEGAADTAVLRREFDRARDMYASAIEAVFDDPVRVARMGAKAVLGLWAGQSNAHARTVGLAALEACGLRVPRTAPGRAVAVLARMMGASPRRRAPAPIRDALCELHIKLAVTFLAVDHAAIAYFLLGAYRLSDGLETSSAAEATALYAAILGSMGKHGRSVELFERAETIVRESPDKWVTGIIHHLRAHMLELPSGSYDEGQRSLSRAVTCFREIGDLSFCALSGFMRAGYGRWREPCTQLIEWLDDAELAGKHGNGLALGEIRALRCLIRIRIGASGRGPAVDALLQEHVADEAHPDAIMTCIYLAECLLELGRPQQARQQVGLAYSMLAQLPSGGVDLLNDLHWAAVRVALQTPGGDAKAVRRGLRGLRRATTRSARYVPMYALAQALVALHASDTDKARMLATEVIRRHDEHLQAELTRRAHLMLEQIMRGSDVVGAREHGRLARALARELRVEPDTQALDPAAHLPTLGPSPRWPLEHSDRPRTIDIAALVATVANRCGHEPRVEVGGERRALALAAAQRSTVETLVTQLVLCARDGAGQTAVRGRIVYEQIGQEAAAALPEARAGDYVALSLLTASARSGVVPGLGACQQLAAQAGGSVSVRERGHVGSELVLLLPADPTRHAAPRSEVRASRRRIAVIHSETRVRRTIVAAVQDLGYEVVHAPSWEDAGSMDGVSVVFCDPPDVDPSHFEGRTVPIVARQDWSAAARATALSFPFDVQDLERIIDGDPD